MENQNEKSQSNIWKTLFITGCVCVVISVLVATITVNKILSRASEGVSKKTVELTEFFEKKIANVESRGKVSEKRIGHAKRLVAIAKNRETSDWGGFLVTVVGLYAIEDEHISVHEIEGMELVENFVNEKKGKVKFLDVKDFVFADPRVSKIINSYENQLKIKN